MDVKALFTSGVVILTAVAMPGCRDFEEAALSPLPVVVATRVTIPHGIDPVTPEICGAFATDVRWVFTSLEGLQGATEVVKEPDAASGTPGGFDDSEPQLPLPGVCVFRAELGLPPGASWAVEARLTFEGAPWSAGCTIAPVPQDLDIEQCEVPDWVGSTAQGITPGASGCLFAVGDPEAGCGLGDQVTGNWGDFPPPD